MPPAQSASALRLSPNDCPSHVTCAPSVGSRHFDKLDDEARALNESWRQVARVVALTGLLAVFVWAACAVLRHLVHLASEWVVEHAEERTATGAAVLLGALVLGGTARALLYRWPSWRKAAGDGMEQALANYHVTYEQPGDDPGPRYARPDLALAAKKSLTTWLSLGSGGSGGLEAPMVSISENLAAGFSRLFRVKSEHELRTYQLAGIAAAVSTLLGAPFTAALFASEIAYSDRIVYRKLAYSLWAGVVAFWLNTWLRGRYVPLLSAPKHALEYSIAELGAAALVAVAVSVPLALSYGRAMGSLDKLVGRVRPAWHGPVTALAVGGLALGLYWGAGLHPGHVLGTGERTLAGIMSGSSELGVLLLLLALAGKVVATGLTLGGGGSVGLLFPSMYLGGAAGALVARLLNLLGLGLDPALFAVVGIASSLVAVVGVPLAAIALVLEVFGKAFGPPAILACGVTYLLTLKVKVYASRLSVEAAAPEPAPPPPPPG
ncbi:MAG: chloride channel protein [Myxococcaceae bacterium]|nr:chloride channel protein [Myxococcaceae bacterium]